MNIPNYTPDEIYRLRYNERLSYSEVAIKLGITVKDVRETLCKVKGVKQEKRDSRLNSKGHISNGYFFLRTSKGCVAEHRLVWEQNHQRPIPKGWVIHHINGVKRDNRPENLLAVPRKNHSPGLKVKEIQARLRKVEYELFRLKAERKLL